jgi:hypothetical protein
VENKVGNGLQSGGNFPFWGREEDVLPQRRVSAQGAVGTSVVELEAHVKYVQNPYSQEHRGIYDESGPLQHIDPSVWTMGYYFKLQVLRMDTGQQGLAKGLKLRGMKPRTTIIRLGLYGRCNCTF